MLRYLVVALLAALVSGVPASAAGEQPWLLKSGQLVVSERVFKMALTVRGRDTTADALRRRAEASLAQQRTRLLLAAAAERAGLGRSENVEQALSGYRLEHLADQFVQERVAVPARASARKLAAGVAREETRIFKQESERLLKELTAKAREEFPAAFDEKTIREALRVGDPAAVVARVAGGAVLLGELRPKLAAVDHPGTRDATRDVEVVKLVLEGVLTGRRFAALAEREGFAARPDVESDLMNRRLRLLAEAYVARKIAPSVLVAEKDVAALYEERKESLRRGEEKEISEILVEEKERAEEILARLRKGSDFTAEAKAHSRGPTGASGGRVGFIAKGQLLPAFDTAVEALKPGDVSPVLHSAAGYHILRCGGVVSGRTPPLAEVRDSLEKTLREKMLEQARTAAVGKLEKEIPVEFNEQRFKEILKSL